MDNAIGAFEMLWDQGFKMIKKNEPESYAYSWNYLRKKVNTIEDNNIKIAYRDEIEKRIRIFRERNKNINLKINNFSSYTWSRTSSCFWKRYR